MILAQEVAPDVPFVFGLACIGGLLVFMWFSFTILLARQYKRCPSNRVLVIFGRTGGREAARLIHGGAAFIVPLLQDCAYLGLEPIDFELQTKGVALTDGKHADVTTAFSVAVGTEPKVLNNAAVRLLGLSFEQIQQQAERIIAEPLRQALATMSENELRSGRADFHGQMIETVERRLNEIGLKLISASVSEVASAPE